MQPDSPFDKNSLIDALLDKYPKLAEVFNAHGMACVGCVFSRFHSVADAAAIYKLDPESLIAELSHKYRRLTNSSHSEEM